MGRNRLNYIWILLALLVFASCVPQNANRKSTDEEQSESSGGTTNTTTTTSTNSPFANDSSKDLFWYTSENLGAQLTINYSENFVLYLRGNNVHNFLAQSGDIRSQDYCFVASFYTGDISTSKIFRARAIPQTVNSFIFNTTSVEYLFKIDLNDTTNASKNCNGQLPLVNLTGRTLTYTANAAYTLEEVCPDCSQSFTASRLGLFTTTINNSELIDSVAPVNEVPGNQIDLNSLSLRVDYTPVNEFNNNQCSTNTCRALGFDCCLNGQCVKDKSLKDETDQAFKCLAQVESNPGDYSLCLPTRDVSSYNNIFIMYGQAYADKKTNVQSYLNYPNFYYICSSDQITEPEDDTVLIDNPDEVASAQLEQQIADYYCLEEGKKEAPDYSREQRCAPGFDQASHDALLLDVYKRCGCDADPFPTDPDDPRCPHYGLKVEKDLSDNITKVLCDIPDPILEPKPFQNLSLNVPARSAPHRFFDTDGMTYDDLQTAAKEDAQKTQEGLSFEYMDKFSKLNPIQEKFSMNAILGPMLVDLTMAQPAKVVNVEFGQTYIVSAVSGFYTPCPQCVEDSWFASFKSHPSSQSGLGTLASGGITNRSLYSENMGLGNYEDTIFGRACWLPPTMIPWTHKPKANFQTQRLNRLKTQAALYVNGYQRDWYGFNQGALIGSFDGVTWFAVGKGRRVNATSTKLFLAINAPFADLAEPSDVTASVIQDLGGNVVADYDWDPELELNDPRQNQGASCQKFHQCETDSDCVANLGWEYVCSDIDLFSTNWPKFDADGNEIENQEYNNAGYIQILQGIMPSGSTKRCMYRGAGAVCKRNYTTLDQNLPDLQEQFRCAPNFYCQELTGSEFNSKLIRTPNQQNSFLYGQEGDTLGRPEIYVGATDRLEDEIIENLQHNFSAIASDISDFGVCRPGKNLTSSDQLIQHSQLDVFHRTDYINQISSCDSEAIGDARTQTCPVFEDDEENENYGNYVFTNDPLRRNQQNMCGGESLFSFGAENQSTFKTIEAERTSKVYSIVAPTVVGDACYRRAGSFCHTDLDCSPNRLHEEQAQLLSKDSFGGTEAELQFWQEGLVCGQPQSKPLIQDTDFLNFDLTQNRCCREVGKTITMYTQSDSLDVNPELGQNNLTLEVGRYPYLNPAANNRYSRYSVANASDLPDGFVPLEPFPQLPIVNANQTPKLYQWKTFEETGERTCCGGGWIRKFADGTHDWTVNNRLNINVSNFECLNYSNSLAIEKPDEVTQRNYEFDYSYLCYDVDQGGCIQQDFPKAEGEEIVLPRDPGTTIATLDTTPSEKPSSCSSDAQEMSSDVPFMPTPVPLQSDLDPDCGVARNYFNTQLDYAISFRLPTYIGHLGNIRTAEIIYKNEDGSDTAPRDLKSMSGSTSGIDECPNTNFDPAIRDNIEADHWCYEVRNGSEVILHVRAVIAIDNDEFGDDPSQWPFDQADASKSWAYGGIRITFGNPGTVGYLYGAPSVPSGTVAWNSGGVSDPTRSGMLPGNKNYYITKLARFELLGIPQIFYEPLYCNSDRSKIVDGFFKSEPTRASFEALSPGLFFNPFVGNYTLEGMYDANSTTFDIANSNQKIVYQDQVELPAIFASNEFTCCAKLGNTVETADKCCSNFATQNTDGDLECKLPSGTDLNVYFNRFVSSEGVGEDLPEEGLKDEDFIPHTGEPKINDQVIKKLAALGDLYCEKGAGTVINGAAFGRFYGQPNSGFYNGDPENGRKRGIVDSPQDFDQDFESGFIPFINGLRWDTHLYCE